MDDKIKFEKFGGAMHPVIHNAQDMRKILDLNPALWSVVSVSVSNVTADRDFLQFIDTDKNGKVRVDEVKSAVSWLLRVLKSFDGVNQGSDVLLLNEINRDDPEGKQLFESALLILLNLKKKNLLQISMQDVLDREKILACGMRNGDGVIPVDLIPDPELIPFAKLAAEAGGSSTDLSGMTGYSRASLDTFLKRVTAWLAWVDEGKDPALYPYGPQTEALSRLCEELNPKMEEFFQFCEAAALFGKVSAGELPNILDSSAMTNAIQQAPVATPCPGGVLSLKESLNPLWRKKLHSFFSAALPGVENITAEKWEEIRSRFASFRTYMSRKPEDAFDKVDPEYIRSCLEQNFPERLSALIDTDMIFGDSIRAYAQVRKLLLFQKYMLLFLNNFVSMRMLFLRRCHSMYQVGDLVIDGRIFRMVTRISSVAEHKKIAERSNICVLYLEVSTGTGSAMKKDLLAAAITSGGVNQLFTGKLGVFITPDQTVWDAKVIDYLQQPVSISEALKSPFYRFGDFLGKQADKFFSARTKEFDQNFAKDLNKVTAPPPAAKVQTPAVSGSMMLMGGGVGLAALGSAIAFIAQSIKKVSFWDIVTVFVGILLIFGGPMVIVSLVKLYRRSISVFLEASGVAVNKQMRLSRAMARIFTADPMEVMPLMLQKMDFIKQYLDPEKKKRSFFWLWVLIAVLLGSGIGFGIWLWLLFPYLG